MRRKDIQITNFHRITKPGFDSDHVEGYFIQDEKYTFEIFLEDTPNSSTYGGTRMAEIYIKYLGAIHWSWAGYAPLDKEPDDKLTKSLFSILLTGLKSELPSYEDKFDTKRGESVFTVVARSKPLTAEESEELEKNYILENKRNIVAYERRANGQSLLRRRTIRNCLVIGILLRETPKYYIYAENAHLTDEPVESVREQRIWKRKVHLDPCTRCFDHSKTHYPGGREGKWVSASSYSSKR